MLRFSLAVSWLLIHGLAYLLHTLISIADGFTGARAKEGEARRRLTDTLDPLARKQGWQVTEKTVRTAEALPSPWVAPNLTPELWDELESGRI